MAGDGFGGCLSGHGLPPVSSQARLQIRASGVLLVLAINPSRDMLMEAITLSMVNYGFLNFSLKADIFPGFLQLPKHIWPIV